jgi:hypothetical protein
LAGTTTFFDVLARQATYVGDIGSLESIPWLLKHLQIRAQYSISVGWNKTNESSFSFDVSFQSL